MKKLIIEAAELAAQIFKEVAEIVFFIVAIGLLLYFIFSPIFK